MFSGLPFGFLFIFTMIFGTIFSISSSHWLGIWAGLEINLIGFLPILVYQKSMSESESAVKYFIVQALGSSLLIFGSLMGCSISFSWENFVESSMSLTVMLVVSSGLLVKMGMFPFHYWLPSVMAGLPWISCMLLATWQKIAPLLLINSLFELNLMYYFVLTICFMASASSLMGGIGGMNQTQVRAILAYSSIGHLGWMMFALTQGVWAMKIYLMIYILISICIFSNLWYSNLNNMKNLSMLMKSNDHQKTSIMLLLLSLGGLPPLLGFVSKWVVIASVIDSKLWFFLMILVTGSVMSLFYYLSLYFSVFLGFSKKFIMNLFVKEKNLNFVLNVGVMMNLLGGLSLIIINSMWQI
uniref:NADH-ubiquinone oxidoreductase chain 2 n=1 Tax=Notocochlis gualtieriana TaxID=2671062 RepID=A0A6G6D639_9CAEN|nr:NADH dehydrogenase subunit 2 [Notocochlis gualtieriana]QIE12009.1 NADH dehydrogenase subunit 2 [Notocochlis gualtieriana]